MKGASASFASRLAISVFPQPVGPIIRMFFGTMSSFSGLAILDLRQRLRRATATARLASACFEERRRVRGVTSAWLQPVRQTFDSTHVGMHALISHARRHAGQMRRSSTWPTM